MSTKMQSSGNIRYWNRICQILRPNIRIRWKMSIRSCPKNYLAREFLKQCYMVQFSYTYVIFIIYIVPLIKLTDDKMCYLSDDEKQLKCKIFQQNATNKRHKTSRCLQLLSLVQEFQRLFHTNRLNNTGCK